MRIRQELSEGIKECLRNIPVVNAEKHKALADLFEVDVEFVEQLDKEIKRNERFVKNEK